MNKEELIKRVKECGQSLIDNAESIVGNEWLLQNICISCDVNSFDKIPQITVSRDFIPEGFLKRNTHSPSAHIAGTKCPACEEKQVEDDKRICSECGKEIISGYYVDANENDTYYCGEECLHKHYPKEVYNEMYKNGTAYFTNWF